MNTKPSNKPKKQSKTGGIVLAVLTALFLIPALGIAVWFGSTAIRTTKTSAFPGRDLVITYAGQRCTLEMPAGTVTVSSPKRAAAEVDYDLTAELNFDGEFRLKDCQDGIPNWTVALEGEAELPAADVKPYAAIRQPVLERPEIKYEWTFTPKAQSAGINGRLWMRVEVSEKDAPVESWDMLVRDIPLKYTALFSVSPVFWYLTAGICAVIGLLFLILLLQWRKKRAVRS